MSLLNFYGNTTTMQSKIQNIFIISEVFCASYSQFPFSKKQLLFDLFDSAKCSLLVVSHDTITTQAVYPLSIAQLGEIFT